MKNYNIGDIVEGKVTGIESYGIFVNIDDEYTGLIHISEIDNNFVKSIKDYVELNQVIYACVLDVSKSTKHMNLSIKNLNYAKKNLNGQESVRGFLPLANELPKWIDKKLDEIKK